MSMNTPRDLFEHELLDLYDAEHRLLKALPEMAREATDEKLRAGFEKHAKQTEQHVQRIEQACEQLDIKPKREKCAGMAGLIAEHDQFVKEEPSEEVLTLFLTSAAQKTEHYEIVSYRGLISMAKDMGEKGVADLLAQNLKDEETMASELEKIEKSLEKQAVAAS